MTAEEYDYYDTTFFFLVCCISILLHTALAFTHWDHNHIRSRVTKSVERAVLHWKRYFLFGFLFPTATTYTPLAMSSIAIYDLVLVAFWWRVMRVYTYICYTAIRSAESFSLAASQKSLLMARTC